MTTHPTDPELEAFATEEQFLLFCDVDEFTQIARAVLAKWGAPAQPAPTYKDSTPELHVGDSAFESWYSTYNPAHKSDKQRARDAYAAGMGDPLVMAAPAAVAGQCEDAIELLGKYKELCEEIKRGDSYHLGRIEAAISVLTQADSQSVPVWEEEREAFKAAHRHLGLDEVPDAWGQPTFKHSHVEASWLGWIARAARAPADSALEDAERWQTFIALPYATRVEWVSNLSLAPVLTQWVDTARKQGVRHDNP